MSDLPDPPTPADSSLRGFGMMSIRIRALQQSTFNALANDSEFRMAFNLWMAAWEQIPAGSLPASDREIWVLGNRVLSIKKLIKSRSVILRGWYLCKDGRLYHPVLSEIVNYALRNRRGGKARGVAKRLRDKTTVCDKNPTPIKKPIELVTNAFDAELPITSERVPQVPGTRSLSKDAQT